MYSFPNLESVHCSLYSSNCRFLTTYRFLKRQESVCHLLKNFPQFVVIHPSKGFSVFNEAGDFFFLEFPCFLYDPVNFGHVISGSSAFSKHKLYIWKFSFHVLLQPSLKDFEHNLTSMGSERKCIEMIEHGKMCVCLQ